MKTFYFPSMKNIIFEVINIMLLTKEQPLTFDQDVICSLIEQLNLFGMSVEKFKRILKLIIAEFVHSNKYVLVHDIITDMKEPKNKKSNSMLTMSMKKEPDQKLFKSIETKVIRSHEKHA